MSRHDTPGPNTPQQMLWDGQCPRDGTPIALHWAPDGDAGTVFIYHWWQCKHGHTFPSEYDREMGDQAPVWEGW